MAKIRRRSPEIAVLKMLQRIRDAADPGGGLSCGARVNVFRAAAKGGWLLAGTDALTGEGRRAPAARESRRRVAA